MKNKTVEQKIFEVIGDEYQDSNWEVLESSIPHRGITDYGRTIVPPRSLTEDEITNITKILREDPKCPGWTGVIVDKSYNGPGIKFFTCWDSSD